MSLRPLSFAALSLFACCAQAAPDAWFVEGAVAERETSAVTAGVKWNWDWKRPLGPVAAGGSTEVFASYWLHRDVPSGRTGTLVAGVVPLVRLTFDQGRSPWFFEGGIGLSLADKRYVTPEKQFSTRWNFYDVLALGRGFGDSEVSLRITHTSNGSAKRPNPGENFLQLRYAVKY